ncbi:MAG: hypothetical protein HDR72_03670 [Ruminococcaceae bacterium]|nr:hypothetical protein [Oscillospiraceae bacterium]
MTKFTLADAIGNIGERQIHRALNYRRRANKLLWLAPVAACLVIAVCLIPMLLNTSTEPPVSDPVDSIDDKNPGGATNENHYLSYNGEYFEFDHCVIRIVYDDNGRIIEPEKADWDDFTEETLKAADKLDTLEYIGTGEVIGTDPNAKLYMMPSGNILAVRLCIIEPYTDAEEMLAKYPKDSIFEIFTFIKVYNV